MRILTWLSYFLILSGAISVQAFTHSGNTYTTTGASSDVQAAVTAATNGSTIIIPNGNYTWTSKVTVKNAVTITAATLGNVNITLGSGTPFLFVFQLSSSGNPQLAGINFLPGSANAGQSYVNVVGSGKVMIVHDCSFSIPNFQITAAFDWFASGGLIYNCHFFSDVDGGGGGWGSGSGCIRVMSNIPWVAVSSFGILDSGGDKNLYIEDCTFDNIYNQCVDVDDNGRLVVRHCVINNTQMLTHGTTSKQGGRQVELYNNSFNYKTMPANSAGFKTVNVNRWFWWRAGTARVHDNQVDKINSGDWGNKPSWLFIAESLTRSGAGSGCQTEADYQGVHWPGSGGDGSRQVPDPIYFWNNTGEGAAAWATSDQSGYDCHGGSSANVIKEGRDIRFETPSGYIAFSYPHPLRGGAPQPTPTSAPSATPTPQPTPTPPQPTPTPEASPTYRQWWDRQAEWLKANPPVPDP